MTVQERPTREDLLANEAQWAVFKWNGWREELMLRTGLGLWAGIVTQEFYDEMEACLYGPSSCSDLHSKNTTYQMKRGGER